MRAPTDPATTERAADRAADRAPDPAPNPAPDPAGDPAHGPAVDPGSAILVVEDDRDIAHLIEATLGADGHRVTVVHDGADGLRRGLDDDAELVVLDLMLPGLDGLELCRRLRGARPDLLLLVLTARSSEFDRVLGLELGADDYLTKPFSLRELAARVRALLRRKRQLQRTGGEPGERLERGPLTLDVAGRAVTLRGAGVHLTAREFDLLLQFARAPGRVFRRTELLDLVWGAGFDGFEHTVNSHINRLRGKIERDPADPRLIRTVWGVGYKFTPDE